MKNSLSKCTISSKYKANCFPVSRAKISRSPPLRWGRKASTVKAETSKVSRERVEGSFPLRKTPQHSQLFNIICNLTTKQYRTSPKTCFAAFRPDVWSIRETVYRDLDRKHTGNVTRVVASRCSC